MPRYVGATHAAAIAFVLKDFKGWDYPIDPFLDKPKSYHDLAGIMSTAFATFIATGDPNLRAGGGMFSLENLTDKIAFFNAICICALCVSKWMRKTRYTIVKRWALTLSIDTVNGTRWPQYTNESQQNLVFDANVTSYVEEDTWRRRGTDYLQSFLLEG